MNRGARYQSRVTVRESSRARTCTPCPGRARPLTRAREEIAAHTLLLVPPMRMRSFAFFFARFFLFASLLVGCSHAQASGESTTADDGQRAVGDESKTSAPAFPGPPAQDPEPAPFVAVEARVGGKKFIAKGAAAKQDLVQADADAPKRASASIAIGDVPSLCAARRGEVGPVLRLLATARKPGHTIDPGVYRITRAAGVPTEPMTAKVEVVRLLEDGCTRETIDVAPEGTVTIEQARASRIEGWFDVTLEKNGRATGHFVIDVCPFQAFADAPDGGPPAPGKSVPDDGTIKCAL
jgi:hypothetical protein